MPQVLDEILAQGRARRALRPAFARAVRIEAGVSQPQLARALGVSPSAVCRWESGQRLPRGPLAKRYAAVLARLEHGR